MRFVKFPSADTIVGLGQKEFKPIPAKYEAHNKGRVTMCAELSREDLDRINKEGKVYIELLTFNKPMNPIRVSVFPPEGITTGTIKMRVNYNSDAPEPDHTGHYIIKGYLPSKSTVVPGGTPGLSWQNIHKTKNRDEHVAKLKELLSSGEYEMEA